MAESKIKTLFSRESAKAWVAAATVVVTQVAAVLVPDSAPGKLVASVLGVLLALGAVFGTSNAPAQKNEGPVDWSRVDLPK